MKKIKLISSLSSLAVLSAATPIVATSCSNSKDIDIILDDFNSDFEYKRGMTGWISIRGYSYDGTMHGTDFSDDWFKKDSIKATCNTNGITVDDQYAYNTGFILVKIDNSVVNGSYTVSISAEDKDGHKGSRDVTITVADHAYTAYLRNWDGWDTFNMLYYYEEHYDMTDYLVIDFVDGNQRLDESKYDVKFTVLSHSEKGWPETGYPTWFTPKDSEAGSPASLTITDTDEPATQIPNNAYVWFKYTVTVHDDPSANIVNYAMFYANFDY